VSAGSVISQSPTAGSSVADGSAVEPGGEHGCSDRERTERGGPDAGGGDDGDHQRGAGGGDGDTAVERDGVGGASVISQSPTAGSSVADGSAVKPGGEHGCGRP